MVKEIVAGSNGSFPSAFAAVGPAVQAPVVTTSSGAAAAIEQNPVAIDASLTLADGDSTTLASATVSITGGFVRGQDSLAFANDGATMGNVLGSYDDATGILTLISAGATASVAQFQAALRAVTYTNTSDAPVTTARTIAIAANDGTVTGSAATVPCRSPG